MNPSSITIKIEFGQDGSGTIVKDISGGDAAPTPSSDAVVHTGLSSSIPFPDMTSRAAGAQEEIPTPFSGGAGFLVATSAPPIPDLNPAALSGGSDEAPPPHPEEAQTAGKKGAK